MKKTLVTIEILDEQDGREWWLALGLPEPWRWSDGFGADVFAEVLLERDQAVDRMAARFDRLDEQAGKLQRELEPGGTND